jgi:MFS family permease
MLEMFTGLGCVVGPVIITVLCLMFGAFWAFTILALLIFAAYIPASKGLGAERPYFIRLQPELKASAIICDSVRHT